jgi:hypothetical protein
MTILTHISVRAADCVWARPRNAAIAPVGSARVLAQPLIASGMVLGQRQSIGAKTCADAPSLDAHGGRAP